MTVIAEEKLVFSHRSDEESCFTSEDLKALFGI